MNARTMSSADKIENNSRNGQSGVSAAPHSDASSNRKVEPTTHQLVLTDSTPNGRVALNRSLSACTSVRVSGTFPSIDLASQVALFMASIVNAPIRESF